MPQLRKPDSRRGVREMPDYTPDKPELPEAPEYLVPSAKAIFHQMVRDLVKAGVPVKAVDGHAIGNAAMCQDQVAYWSKLMPTLQNEARLQCAQMIARFQRDAQEWIAVTGQSPKSRAQMGLRGKTEAKKMGTVASILAAKRQA